MKWLSRTLISNPYEYALCLDPKEFRRFLRHIEMPQSEWPEFISSSAAAEVNLITHKGCRYAIVCLAPSFEDLAPAELLALLVHEAVHIWQGVREYMGEDEPSSEFEAYSVQGISQTLIAAYIATRPPASAPIPDPAPSA